MTNCIFCSIVSGDIPSYKVYEDEHTYAFLDIACDYVGHTVVVPKCHTADVLQCDSDTMAHVMHAVQVISRHYVEHCGYTGVNIFNNCGTDAGQSVMHMHMHIIPRKADDKQEIFVAGAKADIQLAELVKQLAL